MEREKFVEISYPEDAQDENIVDKKGAIRAYYESIGLFNNQSGVKSRNEAFERLNNVQRLLKLRQKMHLVIQKKPAS